MITLRDLTSTHPRTGIVTDLVLRPRSGEPAIRVDEARAIPGLGLEGDRRAIGKPAATRSRKRELTLLQAEHLPLIAHWTGRDTIDARVLRRNIVVAGLNVLAMKSPFKDRPLTWRIGDEVLILVTGPCDPCSKMEAALGAGAYNAMRGHGGVTASIVRGGRIRVGDPVRLDASGENASACVAADFRQRGAGL